MLAQVGWWLIYVYQKTLSPWLATCCRFTPSCSHYSQQALLLHPLPVALWLILSRLLSCHPFHPGGYDPVPLIGYQMKKCHLLGRWLG